MHLQNTSLHFASLSLQIPMSSSSAGPGGGNGSTVAASVDHPPQQFFCHQCNRTFSISPSPSDYVCPNCNGGFFEELETPIPNPNPNPNPTVTATFFPFTPDFAAAAAASIPQTFPGPGAPPIENRGNFTGNIGDGGDAATGNATDPIVMLQNYVQALRNSGINASLIVENSGTAVPPVPAGATVSAAFQFRPTVPLDEYFFGTGIEELIQQLTENHFFPGGSPPPASRTAVEGLLDITIDEELLGSDSSQCAVCKDTFEIGKTVKQMPCKHFYHTDCILPWLGRHNSCPVCRYLLPTDDPAYEQWRARRSGGPRPNQNRGVGSGGSDDSSSGSGVGGGSDGGDNMLPMWGRSRRVLTLRVPGGLADPSSGGGGGGGGGDNVQSMLERLFRVADGSGGGEGEDNAQPIGDNLQPTGERRVFMVPGGLADPTFDSGGADGGGGVNMLPTGERTAVRVSLPWLRQYVSPPTERINTASNNSNGDNNSGNNNGQSNSESRINQNFESETRQEDLD